MEYYYAILDVETDICMQVISHTRGDLADINSQYIKIPELNNKFYINQKYDREQQKWSGEYVQPKPAPLSEQQQSILDTAINIEYLVCLADLGI